MGILHCSQCGSLSIFFMIYVTFKPMGTLPLLNGLHKLCVKNAVPPYSDCALCMCVSCPASSSSVVGHWGALLVGEWLHWSKECVWSPCPPWERPTELLYGRDAQVPLPPVQWRHRPSPGPVGVQHWGTSLTCAGSHAFIDSRVTDGAFGRLILFHIFVHEY